jgi:hypothetical protein
MARHYAEELRQPAGSEASSDRLDAKTSAPMAWLQIRKLGRENPGCSTLPQDPGFVFPALDEQGLRTCQEINALFCLGVGLIV